MMDVNVRRAGGRRSRFPQTYRIDTALKMGLCDSELEPALTK